MKKIIGISVCILLIMIGTISPIVIGAVKSIKESSSLRYEEANNIIPNQFYSVDIGTVTGLFDEGENGRGYWVDIIDVFNGIARMPLSDPILHLNVLYNFECRENYYGADVDLVMKINFGIYSYERQIHINQENTVYSGSFYVW